PLLNGCAAMGWRNMTTGQREEKYTKKKEAWFGPSRICRAPLHQSETRKPTLTAFWRGWVSTMAGSNLHRNIPTLNAENFLKAFLGRYGASPVLGVSGDWGQAGLADP